MANKEATSAELESFSEAMLTLPEAGMRDHEVPPILKKIAYCESRNRHYDKNGEVLRGTYNRYDIGKYQINVLYWGEKAKELGYDIFTEKGNEAMAVSMYRDQGTKPWVHSRSCWSKDVAIVS